MIVYAALYNHCIHESAPGVISLHKSEKGAETAMYLHRAQEREKFNEEIKEFGNPFDLTFGNNEWWGVESMTVLD